MIAVLRAQPGHERDLESAVRTLAAAVRREPGCREFRSFRDFSEPGTLYLYEIYDDAEAFRDHLRTPHVSEFFTQLGSRSTSDATALTQLDEI